MEYYFYLLSLTLVTVYCSVAVAGNENGELHVSTSTTPQDNSNTATDYNINSHVLGILKGGDGRDDKEDKGETGQKGNVGPARPEGKRRKQDLTEVGGVVYIRWGRTVCPNTYGTELVYVGLAAGTDRNHIGGGANYICVTKTPKYINTDELNDFSYLYGAEYQHPVFNTSLNNNNAPCAVCYTSERSSKLMIPGEIDCPSSWTQEYVGYLMAEHYLNNHNAAFECVDKDAEGVPGSQASTPGARLFHFGARCNDGVLCPPYQINRPITCVVCTI